MYPYSALGLCLYAVPDGSVTKKSSGYECESGYLYIYGSDEDSHAKCVSKDDCVKDGAIVYEENKTCIKDHSCTEVGAYLYRGTAGDECVSAEKCLQSAG